MPQTKHEEFKAWMRLAHPSHSLKQNLDTKDYLSAGTQHKWLGYEAGTLVDRSDTAELYFEAHITLDPVPESERAEVEAMVRRYGFKLAKLLMDKGVPSQIDTLMTGHSRSLKQLSGDMRSAIAAVQHSGRVVRRYKIEDTVLDSWHKDVFKLL